MQDQNQKTQINPIPTKLDTTASPTAVKPAEKKVEVPGILPQENFERRIADKIQNSENILVALSRDPSVDEMAAAIGLTMFLDGLQKHTTAIYSGATPDALEFLRPAETFETNTDSLQDFIIALSKDKADHLRYKLDGDFVKVYITPYKTVLSEGDLEFSHGDYNVDLVLALGVPQAVDLDEALSEHGRIMHDATIVDITCDAPGRFGEIEWSDPSASSVSEMVAKLIFAMQGKEAVVDKEIATALLTGIVAATGRFSNDRTNSKTMQLASKLMTMGADQQLISANVIDNDGTAVEMPGMVGVEAAGTYEMSSMPGMTDLSGATGAEMPTEAAPVTGLAEMAPVVVAPLTEETTETTVEPVADLPALEVPPTVEMEREAVSDAMASAVENVETVNTAVAEAEQAEQAEKTVENKPKDYSAMLAEALEDPATGVNPINGQPVMTTTVVAETPITSGDSTEKVTLPPPPAPEINPGDFRIPGM